VREAGHRLLPLVNDLKSYGYSMTLYYKVRTNIELSYLF
jgi:hypothetical protein